MYAVGIRQFDNPADFTGAMQDDGVFWLPVAARSVSGT
jgi:hypothetical protein